MESPSRIFSYCNHFYNVRHVVISVSILKIDVNFHHCSVAPASRSIEYQVDLVFLYLSSIDKSLSKQVFVISNSVAVQVRISKRVSRSMRLLYTSMCALNLNHQPSNVLRVITWCVRTSKPDACASSVFVYSNFHVLTSL